MATIRELIDAHSKVPGDIRVAQEHWASVQQWFQPFFATQSDWHGLIGNNFSQFPNRGEYPFRGSNWHLFEEPPPKVKRWQGWEMYPTPKVKRAQYLVIDPRQRRPYCTGDWCTDEKDARDSILYRDTSSAVFIRLTETEREFDR